MSIDEASGLARGDVVRSVREQITDLIREDLLCGRMLPGTRLLEVKLSERFGVSRGLIREALAQLTHEGLLVSRPNCGVSVAPEPSDDMRDLVVPIRRATETYALKQFFEKIDDRDFQNWDEIMYRLERAYRDRNEESIVLHHIAFHRSIIVRAGDPDLLAIWQAIFVRVRGHFRQLAHRPRKILGTIVEEHRRLVEAFRTGDKTTAIKALEEHIW